MARQGRVRLPMQWQIDGNGLPEAMWSVRRASIDGPLDPVAFDIPAEVRSVYRPVLGRADLESWPLGDAKRPAIELVPEVVQIPGNWNVTLVRQDDGVVVIEAPISSGYSAKVIAEAQHRFPGMPIKAVVTTSDAWPHIAGIREYAARGVAIQALDRNRPVLDRLLADRRLSKPDTLSRAPRGADVHGVSARSTLGSGANAIVLYPLHGETSERQMMVYFPAHRLLYASDPFQRRAGGSFFLPQTVSEVVDAVAREHLAVDRVFLMHPPPTPLGDLTDELANAKQEDTPTGAL